MNPGCNEFYRPPGHKNNLQQTTAQKNPYFFTSANTMSEIRKQSISTLSEEISASLKREENYCSGHFDENEKVPRAPAFLSTPQPCEQRHGERESMSSSPVSVDTEISTYIDNHARTKVCDWMYRVRKH